MIKFCSKLIEKIFSNEESVSKYRFLSNCALSFNCKILATLGLLAKTRWYTFLILFCLTVENMGKWGGVLNKLNDPMVSVFSLTHFTF